MKQRVLLFCFALLLFLTTGVSSQAQVLEGDAGGGDSYINEYSATGAPIETPLVQPGYANGDMEGIAVSGNDLFTADYYTGNIGEYNLTTGQAINTQYIALPFAGSYGITVANNYLYVSNGGTLYAFNIAGGTPVAAWNDYIGASGGVAVSGNNVFAVVDENSIGEYNALTGAVESANMVTGLYDTFGLTVSDNDLFATSYAGGTVSEFTTSGQTVNAKLVQGIPDGANGLTVYDGDIYVADISQIQEYNETTGAFVRTINSGVEQANSVVFVPEPSTTGLLLCGIPFLMIVRRLRAKRVFVG